MAKKKPTAKKAEPKKAPKPAAKKPRGAKAKPGYLPGLEEMEYPDLSKQCERLTEARADITKARDKEKDIHAKLLDMMKEKNLKAYKHNGKLFQIEAPEKVKYKNLDDKSEDAPDRHDINPGTDTGAPDTLDNPEPTGQSEVLDGVKELAEETRENA